MFCSRLPVLGNLPRYPVPIARAEEPRAHLGRGGEQVPVQLGLLVQGNGTEYGNDDLWMGQDCEHADPTGSQLNADLETILGTRSLLRRFGWYAPQG